MPLQQTSGNVTTDAYGGGVAVTPVYIEDVYSTFLYTGNGSTQTITNGIDLSTYGGLVWTKRRSGALSHYLVTTGLGTSNYLSTDSTAAQGSTTTLLTPSTTGFDFSSNTLVNANTASQVAWTFRKAPKFFDVVTYTGNGTTKTISHNLGAVPGCIIVKDTSSTMSWVVYHRSNGNDKVMYLNGTQAVSTDATVWNSYTPTATDFQVGGSSFSNSNGDTYVAYIFAHNAGGFGLTGTDNVISCGSYTGNGSTTGPVVTLDYEPQWLLVKQSSASGNDWILIDNMRGFPVTGNTQYLNPNNSFSESSFSLITPTATGFQPRTTDAGVNGNGSTYIYIAIRRGPMKVPTSGTSVYETVTSSATAGTVLTTGFPVDLQMQAFRSTTGAHRFMDRLRGVSTNSTAGSISLNSTSDAAETSTGSYSLAWNNTGFQMTTSFESTSGVFWNFRRAPSFFDEVCFTQSDYTQAYTHNLTVVPEMMIVKRRNNTSDWSVYSAALGNTKYLKLQDTGGEFTGGVWGNTSPTSTQFTFSGAGSPNTYVAYLFATCTGVSKVTSFTGNGSTQTINCGFTSGARFVLIKATSTTGNWLVFDTARGMTTSTDPWLALNSTAAESATTGACTTTSVGFTVDESKLTGVNTNGVSYIVLAVA